MRHGNNGTHATDVKIEQQPDLIMPAVGGVERPDDLVSVNKELNVSYLDELKFMEETVDVIVAESTDPNSEDVVSVFNNGVSQYFIRGQVQTVKRKFLEVLARSKQTSISTKDRSVGDVMIKRHTAIRYPFSVVSDANPKGAAWLKGILNEPS